MHVLHENDYFQVACSATPKEFEKSWFLGLTNAKTIQTSYISNRLKENTGQVRDLFFEDLVIFQGVCPIDSTIAGIYFYHTRNNWHKN